MSDSRNRTSDVFRNDINSNDVMEADVLFMRNPVNLDSNKKYDISAVLDEIFRETDVGSIGSELNTKKDKIYLTNQVHQLSNFETKDSLKLNYFTMSCPIGIIEIFCESELSSAKSKSRHYNFTGRKQPHKGTTLNTLKNAEVEILTKENLEKIFNRTSSEKLYEKFINYMKFFITQWRSRSGVVNSSVNNFSELNTDKRKTAIEKPDENLFFSPSLKRMKIEFLINKDPTSNSNLHESDSLQRTLNDK